MIWQPQADGTNGYERLSTEERAAIVADVADRRAALLARQGIVRTEPPHDFGGGRLLVCESEFSLWDGLSESLSCGFFDVFDIPPWDTWVHLQGDGGGDSLLCWVPPSLFSLVGEGIAINCTSCVEWVERLDVTP